MAIGLAAALTSAAAAARAADWPQFRGPGGDGVADPSADPPVEWSETRNVAWKVALPGRGRSSPVVLGDRLWLTTAVERGVRTIRRDGEPNHIADHVSLGAVCLNRADGKVLWHVALFEVDNPGPVHELNSWATPTPAVEPGRLYCDFGTYGTACLDAGTGNVLWTRQLPLDHDVGPGSSPALCGDRLLVVRDGRDAQYVAALEASTGRTLWKTDRPPFDGAKPSSKKSFSTPLPIRRDGQTQVVVPGAQWFASYDLASGQEIWRVRHGTGYSIGARPVSGHGMAYACTGFMKPQLWALRVDGRGDVTGTHVAWKATRQVPIITSPILTGDAICWVSDDGTVCCADAASGQMRWQERLGGKHLASPVLAGGRLYVFALDGRANVLRPGAAFARLAENRLDGPVAATPAAVDKSFYLRTDTHGYRIEAK
jgi:outer membrane protein assembly factor BamB